MKVELDRKGIICLLRGTTPPYSVMNKIPKEYEIPTKEQQDELRDNCTWTWTTQNGVNGYKVISNKNGNSIFLPAAGWYNYNDIYDVGNSGCYMSSSSYLDKYSYNYYLYFNTCRKDWSYNCCFYMLSVRPIKSKTNFKNKTTMTLKEVNEIFPLKTGMCLKITQDKNTFKIILFQYGNVNMCYTHFDGTQSWSRLENLMFEKYDRIEIFKSPSKIKIFDECDKIFDSIDYEVKELTLQEIADKFGVKLENLRIKK